MPFLLPFRADSQKYDLFEVENDELYWRNTYQYSLNEDSLRPYVVALLKSKMYTRNVVRNEIGYSGEIRHYQVDCKKYGRKYNNTPLIYWSGEWSGKFMVEIRDNQYRVTIYGLYFENPPLPPSRYYAGHPRKGYYINEIWKKDKLHFKKHMFSDIALMSLSLKDAFDIKQYSSPLKDW
jgi:hypothetical protein